MPEATLAFVHGLFSGPPTWGHFTRLIESDSELQDSVGVRTFSYWTPYAKFSPLRRIPRLGDIASSFGGWLHDDLAGQRVIIVSHSMGGLVVQRYLAEMVRASRASELRNILAIVMFACPNQGSEVLYLVRKGLPFWRHPQERTLRPLTEEVTTAQQVVMKHIVHASQPLPNAYPIRLWAYAGEADNIVTPQSATFVFDERYCGTLPGDHFTILQPNHHMHRSYVALKSRIIDALQGVESEANLDLGRYAASSTAQILEALTQMRQRWEADRQLGHFGTREFTDLRRAIDRRAVGHILSPEDRRWLLTASIYDGFIPTSVLPGPEDPEILEPAAYWLRRRAPRGPRYRSAFLLERCMRPEREEVARKALAESGSDNAATLADAITKREVINVVQDPKLSSDLNPDDHKDRRQRKHMIEFREWLRDIDKAD